MKNWWIFLIISFGCNEVSKSSNKITSIVADSIIQKSDNILTENNENTKNKDTISEVNSKLDIDTLMIQNLTFYVVQLYPNNDSLTPSFFILDIKNDTVYKHSWFASNGFELEDFDGDGNLDIRLDQISGMSELIMFDFKSLTFKPVINFDEFTQPTKIENTKYWYSYHKSGCADINWGSELFEIVNFEAIEKGDLKGIGCEGEEKNGIFIYKVENKQRKLVFSEIREAGYYGDKWDFIADYWTKNYRIFD